MKSSGLLVLLTAAYALSACARGGASPGPGAVGTSRDFIRTGGFSHESHMALVPDPSERSLGCETCHTVRSDKDYALERPGSKDHAPCDRCHKQAFFSKPGKFCETCHVSVDPRGAAPSPLQPQLSRSHQAQLLSRFSHKVHLSADQVRGPSGNALECSACHAIEGADSAYVSFPVHEACALCHAGAPRDDRPQMANCKSCHDRDGPTRARTFVTNDIRFTHGKHARDAAGKAIDCEQCHSAVARAGSSSERHLPLMKDCATCHQDASRTPEAVRMSNCGLCHTTDVRSRPLPGDHTP